MRQLLLIVLLVVVVLIGGGLLMLGVFPPGPHTQPVVHTLQNDRFQAH